MNQSPNQHDPEAIRSDIDVTRRRMDDTIDALGDRMQPRHLIDEVLGAVKQQSPQFLEKLVVELMQAMGYGGWSKDSGQATQYTADGGVDGLIESLLHRSYG